VTIAETRAEILRLIERLDQPPPRVPERRPRRPSVDPEQRELRLLGMFLELKGQLAKLEEIVKQKPADSARSIPPVESKLPSVIREISTLSGTLREGLLPDVIQLISSSGFSGKLTVSDGETEVEIWFGKGDLHDARSEGLSGESAFFAALSLEEGQFAFKELDEVPPRAITSKVQFLILEGLRKIDEERGG
jgi:hypothetical protein